MSEDFTERRQAEEAVRDSEARFRHLVEQSPLSIQIMNPDGRITQVNEAFMTLWGITEETLPELLEKYNLLEDEEAIKLGLMPLIEKAFKGESVVLPEIGYDAPATAENLGIISPEIQKRFIQVRLYPVKNSRDEVVSVVQIEEDISARKLADKKVDDYQLRLKSLASQLVLVEEQERRHIAADLHDDVGQKLVVSHLHLEAVIKATDDPGLKEQLDEISDMLLETTRGTRQLIFELSSPTVSDFGLGAAINEWADNLLKKSHDIDFELIDKTTDVDIEQNLRAILFRNVRELLTNSLKYARASKVVVTLDRVDNHILVTVQDNGIGFSPSQVMNPVNSEGGFGLFSVQERMSDFGGELEILSAPHQGCTMIMSAPYDEKSKRTS